MVISELFRMEYPATVLALIVITHVDVLSGKSHFISLRLNILAQLYDCRNQQAVTRRMDFFSVGFDDFHFV